MSKNILDLMSNNHKANVSRLDGRRTQTSGRSARIQARDVNAWYGRNHVLADVSLDITGGTTALIGPSGCGKSTFLRILNRLHEKVPGARLSGEVLLEGADIYGRSARPTRTRLHVGMVFQKPNPFPTMSIRENVLSGLRLAGLRCADREGLMREALDQSGLWHEVKNRLDQPGASLSGGQQQRLCIARALAVRPKVLLMDEPCSSLDPTSTRRVEETISHISSRVTVVIVTHNMPQAVRVADRCAFFLADEGQPGRIVEEGAATQIFSDPRDTRTQEYVQGLFG